MKLKKEIKIILIIISIILVILSGYFVYNSFIKRNVVNKHERLHEIKEYEYFLNNNVSNIHKETFIELEKLLKEEDYDNLEYIKLVSKLFAIDFYTLNTKLTNLDITAYQFVHSDIKEEFIQKAEDTIYKYVESNIYNNRKQNLPEVEEVEIIKLEESTLKGYDDVYEVELNIKYVEDLGYDNVLELIICSDNIKMSIIDIKGK